MAPKKIIVVVGATGKQGGSVVETFHGLPDWHVRAITRNPESEAAKALVKNGVDVIGADLADAESLEAPFSGATAIFVNTDFWATFYPAASSLRSKGKDPFPASQQAFDYEAKCRKNAADVAATISTLERYVISSLSTMTEDIKSTRSLHPEAKTFGVEYVRKNLPDLAKKMSVIILAGYVTNRLFVPKLDKSTGVYPFVSPVNPQVHVPVIDPTKSTGPFVRELVENEEAGATLLAYDSNFTLAELAETWSRAAGKKADIVPVTVDQLHAGGIFWEVLEGVDYINKHDMYETLGLSGLIRPHQLKNKVKTKSYEEWAKEADRGALCQ